MTTRAIQVLKIKYGLENGAVKYKKIPQPESPAELFQLHSLMAFIGMRGSGKTNVSGVV